MWSDPLRYLPPRSYSSVAWFLPLHRPGSVSVAGATLSLPGFFYHRTPPYMGIYLTLLKVTVKRDLLWLPESCCKVSPPCGQTATKVQAQLLRLGSLGFVDGRGRSFFVIYVFVCVYVTHKRIIEDMGNKLPPPGKWSYTYLLALWQYSNVLS